MRGHAGAVWRVPRAPGSHRSLARPRDAAHGAAIVRDAPLRGQVAVRGRKYCVRSIDLTDSSRTSAP